MNIDDLRNYPAVKECLDTLKPRPNTERNYLLSMKHFTEWTEKTTLN
jgi:hypothetical protein